MLYFESLRSIIIVDWWCLNLIGSCEYETFDIFAKIGSGRDKIHWHCNITKSIGNTLTYEEFFNFGVFPKSFEG